MVRSQEGEDNGLPYELFMLVLCFFALLSVGVTSAIRLDPDVRSILRWADNAICVVFFLDFLATLYQSKNRRHYFITWGWIDLLSSIPVVGGLRFARLARIWRVVRVLRGARAARLIASFILQRRAEGAFFAVSLLTVLLVVFASIAILQFERGPQANIKGPGDALWWAFTTVITLGYGEHYPVTSAGRFVGAALMIAGVGLVGVVSGLFAAWFLTPGADHQETEIAMLHREVAALREDLRRARPDLGRGEGDYLVRQTGLRNDGQS